MLAGVRQDSAWHQQSSIHLLNQSPSRQSIAVLVHRLQRQRCCFKSIVPCEGPSTATGSVHVWSPCWTYSSGCCILYVQGGMKFPCSCCVTPATLAGCTIATLRLKPLLFGSFPPRTALPKIGGSQQLRRRHRLLDV